MYLASVAFCTYVCFFVQSHLVVDLKEKKSSFLFDLHPLYIQNISMHFALLSLFTISTSE